MFLKKDRKYFINYKFINIIYIRYNYFLREGNEASLEDFFAAYSLSFSICFCLFAVTNSSIFVSFSAGLFIMP